MRPGWSGGAFSYQIMARPARSERVFCGEDYDPCPRQCFRYHRGGMTPLKNARQEAYCQNIIKGMQSIDAYVAAGFARCDPAASKLGAKPHVRARITEMQEKAAAKANVTMERWIAEVAAIAFSDLREVLDFGPGGVTLKDGATLTKVQAGLISEISETKDGNARIRLHSKMDALEKLAKKFGWYAPEKREHDLSDPLKELMLQINGNPTRPGS